MTPLRLELDHAPEAAARARAAVREHLAASLDGADPEHLVDDVVLVTSELVTNAVRHGGPPVVLTVLVLPGGGEVVVACSDGGRWRPEQPADGGRGLPLVRSLSRLVDVDTADGTTVTAHLPG